MLALAELFTGVIADHECAQRDGRMARADDQRQRTGMALRKRALQKRQKPEVPLAIQPSEQQVNHALAAQPEPPGLLPVVTQVVTEALRLTALEHIVGAQGQVLLQAAAGDHALVVTVRADQHQRTRLPVTGPLSPDHGDQHQRFRIAVRFVEAHQ